MIGPEELEKRFTHHPPTEAQVGIYALIRGEAKDLAHLIDAMCPDSREKSTALTKLEECVMHANAAIARHGLPDSELGELA